jgi:hypothetical protein
LAEFLKVKYIVIVNIINVFLVVDLVPACPCSGIAEGPFEGG